MFFIIVSIESEVFVKRNGSMIIIAFYRSHGKDSGETQIGIGKKKGKKEHGLPYNWWANKFYGE